MTDDPIRPPRLTFYVKAAELSQRTATGPLLADIGLTYAQFSMLLSIATNKSASSAELARLHGISAQSAGELIAVLVRRELVFRRADPSHGRILVIELTQAGRKLVLSVQAPLDKIDADLTRGLSAADIDVARRVLSTIASNGSQNDA